MWGLRCVASRLVTYGAEAVVPRTVPRWEPALTARFVTSAVAENEINHPKIRAHNETLYLKKSKQRNSKLRKLFRRLTPEAYTAAISYFENCEKNAKADVSLYTTVLDHTYSMELQRSILDRMVESWEFNMSESGAAFAAAVNTAILYADTSAANALTAEANQMDPRSRRLRNLRRRSDEQTGALRVKTIIEAGRFGCYDDGKALFKAICEADLADIRHWEAALWCCSTYDEQADLWADLDEVRNERNWRAVSVDAFNAVIWRLYIEDRPDDIHRVLNEIRRLKLEPNNRTLQLVQRVGQKIAQEKRRDRDGWKSWQTTFTTQPSPRARVGF